MFTKIELVDSSFKDYIINTDNILNVYQQNDKHVVLLIANDVTCELEITEDSFHRLVGFLLREKRNAQRPVQISVGGGRKHYRRPYRRYDNDTDSRYTNDTDNKTED